MVVKAITSLAEFRTLVNSGKPILVDFWATWCGPCKAVSPIFERFSNDAPNGIEFYKVDVDAQADIAQEVGVRAMPTFYLFKGGNKEGEVVGARPQELEALVKKGASLI
ncbi:Thioredoxin [Psilocybe cubensis]|uniref:Thioredoxin n=2 Tax=Psilocybe cubensis TaxID=181762 RepID=A0ACB8HE24_PSICU|nr:Thioredoxin [Psilocybe cubensis]KAH9486186.1 Thioredoxin [Psilocybe cubensis]